MADIFSPGGGRMHTFFVNTSTSVLNATPDWDVLSDIERENRRLVMLECPLEQWRQVPGGYIACAARMGELINSHAELTNEYDLIIYIDLTERPPYSEMIRRSGNDRDRLSCLRVLHTVYSRLIAVTLTEELEAAGRAPREILIIFGEDRMTSKLNANPDQDMIRRLMLEQLGLPDEKTLERVAREISQKGAEEAGALLYEEVRDHAQEKLQPGIPSCYEQQVREFCEQLMQDQNVGQAVSWLEDRLRDLKRIDAERRHVSEVTIPQSHSAGTVNTAAFTRDRLNLITYVLGCVNAGTVFSGEDKRRAIRPYSEKTEQDMTERLEGKRHLFEDKLTELEGLSGKYDAHHLAPHLYKLPADRVGLDQFGEKAADLVLTEGEKRDPSNPVPPKERLKLTERLRKLKPLIGEKELPRFSHAVELDDAELLKKGTSPERYIDGAKKATRLHKDALRMLKRHVTETLSNYAGQSSENERAVLAKRRVSVNEEGYRQRAAGQSYLQGTEPVTESDRLDTVREMSDSAYATTAEEYLRYCAGRTLSVEGMENACSRFVTRIEELRQSLQRLKFLFLIMLAALVVAYVPFAVIQWKTITQGLVTILIAVGSLLVPILLLAVFFTIAVIRRRGEFRRAWITFRKEWEESLGRVTDAAEQYDTLLGTAIPSLRMVYDYRLDLDFYAECCRLAAAKVSHHRTMLRERVVALGNLIEDLNCPCGQISVPEGQEIDLNVPYCRGKENISFYSVLDTEER